MAPRALATLFFVVLAVTSASAQTSCRGIGADVLTGAIGMLTDTSRSLQSVAQFTPTNFQQQVPQLAQGFVNIANSVQMVLTLQGFVPAGFTYPDADAQKIVATLKTFVAVHQQLLAIVIGDKGFLAGAPYTAGFFEPIRLGLVVLEQQVDAFALKLINMMPTQKTEGQKQSDLLTGSIENARIEYSTPYFSVTVNSGTSNVTQGVGPLNVPLPGGRKMAL
ncbi:hypothetical protein KFL_006440030 [Klebsormidium nitens]|uniref:Uncharacterized protein n=1 Tax=Klebsormidium nitens TaxID=105231 RepID=A0A1Y1INW9_KLENI|nr:hypothetical protein KFL_006440030 [Klebsormidium nitens]|eukprot:GAQ90476.1 hypothetical protein KFL_006440030 [Klebsormidium nitens]